MKMSSSDIESSYGFVAVIDALGVSSRDIEQSKDFLRNLNKLLKDMESLTKSFAEFDKNVPVPELYTFGDTIIFTWDVGKDRIMKGLGPIGAWFCRLILSGVHKKMLLRGAISIGEYVTKENTVIGPALADAAQWYNDADWFGIILTPTLEFHLLTCIYSDNKNRIHYFEQWFVNYNIPWKGESKRKMWCIAWPYKLLLNDSIENSLCILSTMLWDFPKPKGTENKYYHSYKFFKWYFKKIRPHIVEDYPE